MFPRDEATMKSLKIENAMRVMPQDQNTGGFFIALLRKNEDVTFGHKGMPILIRA